MACLALAVLVALPGCGGGGTGDSPSAATSARIAAAVNGYLDALRRNDATGIRAALAPDYRYDGQDAAQASTPFDLTFGLTYRTLDTRIDRLTTRDATATASVATTFEALLNLEPFEFGRPAVNGSGRFELELEQRGDTWLVAAVRPFRLRYTQPSTAAPRLYDVTVNGQLSLDAAPSADIAFAGRSDLGVFLVTTLGQTTRFTELQIELDEPWAVTLPAPSEPGRYLAYALSFSFAAEPDTGEIVVLAGDQITLPVTVTASP